MKYLKSLTILLAGVMVFSSCQDLSLPDAQITSAVRYGKVLFINASPDAPSLVYQVNNTQIASLGPQVTSGYLSINPSSEQFRIKNAVYGVVGTDTTALSGDLVTQSTVAGNGTYTLFVTDTIHRPFGKNAAFSSNKGGLSLIGPVADNLAIASSSAGIRFYNLAPGAAAVYLSNNGVTLGSAISKSIAYKSTTGTSFSLITPGTYNLQVSTGSITGTVLTSQPSITLQPGKVYTVFLTGKVVNSVVKVPYALNVVQHN